LGEVGRNVWRDARKQNRVDKPSKSRVQHVERVSIPALGGDDGWDVVLNDPIRLSCDQRFPFG
jgi:hypothetical protein